MVDNLDAQLLNRSTLKEGEEQRAGRQLKKDRRKKQSGNKQEEKGGEQGKKAKTLRQQLMDTKGKKVKQKAGKYTKKKGKQKTTMPVRMYTNFLLRQSWFWLIPFLGTTLIYIHIHALMSRIFPSFFSPLGEEWIPAPIKQTTGFRGGKSLKVVERIALGVADIIFLIIIFTFLLFMILIVHVATNPVNSLWTIGLKPLGQLLH